MGRPVIDDFLFIEEDARTAVGIYAEAIVAVRGRNEVATPADGEILGRDTLGWGDIVPFEIN